MSNAYIAAAGAPSPNFAWWSTDVGIATIDIALGAVTVAISAGVAFDATLVAGYPKYGAHIDAESLEPDYPDAVPLTFFAPSIVLMPGHMIADQDVSEPFAVIGATYPLYGAALTTAIEQEATIVATYPKYKALIVDEAIVGDIEATYPKYGAQIETDVNYPATIGATYPRYGAALSGYLWTGEIAAGYPAYQAASINYAETPAPINASYPTYRVSAFAEIPALARVVANYPVYRGTINVENDFGARIEAEYGPAHNEIPPRFYYGQLLVAANQNPEIVAKYPKYGAALEAVTTFTIDIGATYPKYGADILIGMDAHIDAVYPKYGAALFATVPGPVAGFIESGYPTYRASIFADIENPSEINATYPRYGADIEVERVPQRRRFFFLVQPV